MKAATAELVKAELIRVRVDADFTVLSTSHMSTDIAASSSAPMLHCFRNFVVVCLLLLLLVVRLKDVQLTAVFVENIEHFSLTFRVSFSFSVGKIEVRFRALTTETLKKTLTHSLTLL